MKMDNQTYDEMRKKASPPSPVVRDCLWAFFVGGAICCAGEGLGTLYRALGFTLTDAGTLVPITGFANAVVSPAIEFRSEGLVSGVGAKMFIIAGPVIVYGMLASVAWGVLYHVLRPWIGG